MDRGDDGDDDDKSPGKQSTAGTGDGDGTGGTSSDGGVITGGKARGSIDMASPAVVKKARVE